MSERIQKFLSNLGYGSRREVEEWITEGRLVVNGATAEIGQKISEEDAVKLDGKRLSLKSGNEPLRVLLYKKRTGEMVTREDPEGRRTVFRKLPDLETGRWIAVGRLDVNTSGLLLMTNHGELARRLMHPSFEQRREYAVRALGEVGEDAFAQLRSGVELEDGAAHFESIRFGDNEVDDDEEDGEGGGRANRWFVVTISEGRHREVRRLFESQGLTVNRLIRTAYGPIKLGRGIKSGGYREASADEMRKLLDAVGLDHAEMLPEKVRASHRAQSEYSASGPLSNRAGKKPRAEGQKPHAEGPKPRFKSGAEGWGRADAKERRGVERRERFERAGPRDEAPRPRFAKPARADGGERPSGTRPWQEKSAAPAAAWPSSRKPRPAPAQTSHDGGDGEPQQFKARGFGARSERSYQERGDRAPAAPTRAYRGESDRKPAREGGSAWAKPAAKPRFARDGEPRRFDSDRPRGERPAFRSRDGEGDRRGPRPAHAEGQRPYRSDGERPAFKPRTRSGDALRYGDRPRDGERPYGARKPFESRGDGPRRSDGDRPAFKPRFKTPDRDGGRSGDRPGARDGYRGNPRDGDRPRRPAGDRPPPRKSGPLQRFSVKDGKAAAPGKPRLGLRSRRSDEKDNGRDD